MQVAHPLTAERVLVVLDKSEGVVRTLGLLVDFPASLCWGYRWPILKAGMDMLTRQQSIKPD